MAVTIFLAPESVVRKPSDVMTSRSRDQNDPLVKCRTAGCPGESDADHPPDGV